MPSNSENVNQFPEAWTLSSDHAIHCNKRTNKMSDFRLHETNGKMQFNRQSNSN